MNNQKISTVNKIYRILTSVSIAVSGIFLIIGCLMIYRFGEGTYSREAVGEIFGLFAIPICLSPVLALTGLILERMFPAAEPKQKNTPDTAFLLVRTYSKKDTAAVGDEILAEQSKRKKNTRLFAIVSAVASVVFLLYACNGAHFDRAEINASIIRAMCVLLPCLAVSFACGIYVLYAREKGLRRELALAKQLPDAEQNTPIPTRDNEKSKRTVRIVLFVLAVALLAVGLFLGGAADVLTKAINICTECIGLG